VGKPAVTLTPTERALVQALVAALVKELRAEAATKTQAGT
jgi:hypothetical protein